MMSFRAFQSFRRGVSHRFGYRVGILTSLIAACQFHLPFYMSRSLPNIFALMLCLFAFGKWLKVRAYNTINSHSLYLLTIYLLNICCKGLRVGGAADRHHRYGCVSLRYVDLAGLPHAANARHQRGSFVLRHISVDLFDRR